jgi:N-acetylmuramic acid 6-phosphate etherase
MLLKKLPQIETLVTQIVAKKIRWKIILHWCWNFRTIRNCGRVRMPTNFGVPFDLVNGIIAGGDIAIRRARKCGGQCLSGLEDLQEHHISE